MYPIVLPAICVLFIKKHLITVALFALYTLNIHYTQWKCTEKPLCILFHVLFDSDNPYIIKVTLYFKKKIFMASKVNLTRSMSIALAFPTFWNLLSNSWNRSSENIKWFNLANQDYFQLLPDSCKTLHVLSRTKMYYFICSVFSEVQDNVPGYRWQYQCEISCNTSSSTIVVEELN